MLREHGALTEFVRLREISRPEDLKSELGSTKSYASWLLDRKAAFTLFLDGFDEASVPFLTLGTWISRSLRDLFPASDSQQYVRLRITKPCAGVVDDT